MHLQSLVDFGVAVVKVLSFFESAHGDLLGIDFIGGVH